MQPLLALAIAVACALLTASPLAAHENRPLYVEIRELAPKRFAVTLKFPPTLALDAAPRLSLPSGCAPLAAQSAVYVCRDDLSDGEIALDWPGANPSLSTLIRLTRVSGESQTALLGPGETGWRPPPPETATGVFGRYLWLGVEHILGGLDHLLFVACLVWLMRTPRRILIGVTGFTLAHSLTLAIAALGLASPPVAAVEAVIALSIALLAAEIVSERRDTLTQRFPIIVAAAFGLLHGLGFASALRETSLPQTEIVSALLAFNLGVELGQIAFVAVLMAIFALLERARVLTLAAAARPAAYGIGVIAAYWTLERLAG